MLKRFLFGCILTLAGIVLFAQDKDTMPGIVDVAKTFYANYTVDSGDYWQAFFEKRPEG
ncbi:MAG TPA: hypothetical protein VGI82_08215 [Chitinophagaceae bacterium]